MSITSTKPDKAAVGDEDLFGTDEDLGEPTATPLETRFPLDVRKAEFSIFELHRRWQNKQLRLQPDFQRAFVWPEAKQVKLIESALALIPLPVIYLSDDSEGLEVLSVLAYRDARDRRRPGRASHTFRNTVAPRLPLSGVEDKAMPRTWLAIAFHSGLTFVLVRRSCSICWSLPRRTARTTLPPPGDPCQANAARTGRGRSRLGGTWLPGQAGVPVEAVKEDHVSASIGAVRIGGGHNLSHHAPGW